MYSYINNSGRRVTGTGATLHEIYSVHGSLQNYHDSIGAQYLQTFIDVHSDNINSNIQTKSCRMKIKVM